MNMIELNEGEINSIAGGVSICNNLSSCLSLVLNTITVVTAVGNFVTSATAGPSYDATGAALAAGMP